MSYPYLGLNFIDWVYAAFLLVGTAILWVIEYFFGGDVIPPIILVIRDFLYLMFIPFIIITHPVYFGRIGFFLLQKCGVLLLGLLGCLALLLHAEFLLSVSLSAYGNPDVIIYPYGLDPYICVVMCALAGLIVCLSGWLIVHLFPRYRQKLVPVVAAWQVPALYAVYMLAVPFFLTWFHPTIASFSDQHLIVFAVCLTGLLVNAIWFECTKDSARRKAVGWFCIMLLIAYGLWIWHPLICEIASACPFCRELLFCYRWL